MNATVLDDLVARTRRRLAAYPIDEVQARDSARTRRLSRHPHRFAEALKRTGAIKVIAEIKAASPSAGPIAPDPDVVSIARAYRDGGASALSVVTEPELFHGKLEWLAPASASADLPVIMKDFIVEEGQLLEGIAAGADAILLLASLLDAERIRHFISVLDEYGCDALVEVHDELELAGAVEAGARLIGVNNRNLHDFSVDLATSERLITSIPRQAIRVSESGIRTREDVERLSLAGFDAFLVGQSLLRQHDRAAAVRNLSSRE